MSGERAGVRVAWQWAVACALLFAPLRASEAAREWTWTPVGPPGGNVRALAADPGNPQRIYLGTADGVLYRSDDGARHWRRMDPGFPRRGCSLDNIAVDPHGVVYAAFWEVGGSGGGVARSADGGLTFTIAPALQSESVRAIAVAPSDPRVVAAGTLGGVFLSHDAGTHWARITRAGDPNLRNVESLAFDPADARVLYAGTWHLSWKTADGGATWGPAHQGIVDDSDIMTLTVDRRHPELVYATACTGVYRSTDAGGSWTKLEGIPASSRRTRAFARSASDPDLLLAGTTEGLWLSDDRGATWRLVTPRETVVNALIVQPDGSIVLGTEEAGVLRSPDRGATWLDGNAGFSERFVSRLLFDDAGHRVVAAAWGAHSQGGVYAAPNVCGPWARLGEGLNGRHVLSLAALDGTVFAGTDDGLFALAAGAATWVKIPVPAAAPGGALRVPELLAVHPGRLIAATSLGVMCSPTAGRTWKRCVPGPGDDVAALAASPSDPDLIVAAARSGCFTSMDGGHTWTQVMSGWPDVMPHRIAFMPDNDRMLLATTSGGLLRSNDGGATWATVGGGVPRSDLTGIAVDPEGRTVWVSDFTRGGIFRSDDGGATWARATTTGLVSDRVWMLAINPDAPSQVVAASAAGGLHLLVPVATATGPTSAR